MDKTYEWIEDRYADDLLGPEQPAPGSASAAAGAAGEDAPLTDLEVMQKKPNFSREMWLDHAPISIVFDIFDDFADAAEGSEAEIVWAAKLC